MVSTLVIILGPFEILRKASLLYFLVSLSICDSI